MGNPCELTFVNLILNKIYNVRIEFIYFKYGVKAQI